MSKLSEVTTGIIEEPRRILLYGVHGIGKTTFGAMAPAAIIFPTEDGSKRVAMARRYPLIKTFEEMMGAIAELFKEAHDYSTVVVDTLDWLERLIFERVCVDNGVESIEKIDYGKGYIFAVRLWQQFIEGLEALRAERNMQIIALAHAQIMRFNDPTSEPYDRYAPALNKHSMPLMMEWADEVLFANYKTYTVKQTESFGKEQFRGTGQGERVIYTTERPAWYAKNRLDLPDEMPLDYRAYAAFVAGETPETPVAEQEQPTKKSRKK